MSRAFRLVQVAGREDHRGPLGGGPRDQRPQVGPADRVDPGGRLVEHQQGRVVQHRGDDAQLLAHPAGQPPGQPVPCVQQPGPLQVLPDARAGHRRRDPVGGRTEGQVLGHGQVRVRARAGGQVAGLDPRRARNRPLAGRDGPAQAAQQRGPAGPVPADHRAHLAGEGPERDPVQGQPVTVADAHGAGAPPAGGRGPAGPGLRGPGLRGPGLCGPGLCGPGLCGPGLCGPGLRGAGRRGTHRDSPTAAAAGAPAAPGAAAGPPRPPADPAGAR